MITMRRAVVALALGAAPSIRPAAAQDARPGRVEGIAFDSTSGSPLSNARIVIVRADDPQRSRSTQSDTRGRFAFDSVAPASYLVGAYHARLDTLALRQLSSEVAVAPGKRVRLSLVTPSPRQFVQQLCGDAVDAEYTGVVHGRIRDAASGSVFGTASLRVEWLDLDVVPNEKDVVQRRLQRAVIQTSPTGEYIACGVPSGGTVRLTALHGTQRSGTIDVEVPSSGVTRMDLAVGHGTATQIHVAGDSILGELETSDSKGDTTTALRGPGRLTTMARTETGAPIANARVSVSGSGVGALTDANGRAVLSSLPTGSYMVDVRALGYDNVRAPVEIRPNDTPTFEPPMRRVTALSRVDVRATRAAAFGPNMVEFEQRRRSGFGTFRGPDDVERIGPFDMGDVLRTMSGIRIIPTRQGSVYLMRESGTGDLCQPEVFIDRTRVTTFLDGGSLDAFVSGQNVQAVEVYSALAPLPAAIMSYTKCGTIVIWTGPRKLPAARRGK